MPSAKGYKRDYQQERETAMSRGETGIGPESKDNKRHKARRLVEKRIGRKLKPTEHVDHKKPLKEGGSNESSNLAVRPAHSNTSEGGKMGSSEGKSAGARKGHKSRLPIKKPT